MKRRPGCVIVTPEAAALLGSTPEKIAKWSILKLANVLYERGLDAEVSSRPVIREGTGHVTVKAADGQLLENDR